MNQKGFTFIELVIVVVILGFLMAIGAKKMLSMAEEAEIAAEDSTIEILRGNLFNNFGELMMKRQAAIFPVNPFQDLSKVPEGFDQFRNSRPTGNPNDDGIWVFIQGAGNTSLNPIQAGTTLRSFTPTGTIFHQRRDHTIVQWSYDSINGIISNKQIVSESALKRQLDSQKRIRGELTEQDINRQRQRQGLSGGGGGRSGR